MQESHCGDFSSTGRFSQDTQPRFGTTQGSRFLFQKYVGTVCRALAKLESLLVFGRRDVPGVMCMPELATKHGSEWRFRADEMRW